MRVYMFVRMHTLLCVYMWWSEVNVKHLLHASVLSLGGLEVRGDLALEVGVQAGSDRLTTGPPTKQGDHPSG